MDSDTLEVTFEPQDTPGQYEMVIGPDILDVAGNAMDQDGDLVVGEVPDDQYTAIFTIEGPRVVGHVPSGALAGPVESIRFDFEHNMDDTSFSVADDIESFIGPGGQLMATGYRWMDSDLSRKTRQVNTRW